MAFRNGFGHALRATIFSFCVVRAAIAGHVDSSVCNVAAASAEREFGLPKGLLAAIGKVEAGRRDPATGASPPWPWTVNVAGQGLFFGTAGEASRYVEALLSQNVHSVDIGCFQVNLSWHPDAFSSVAEAFDPFANARYAASFLSRLRNSAADWGVAIARYHSAAEQRGSLYRSLVFAAWAHDGSVGPSSAGRSDPFIIQMSSQAQGIRVFYGAVQMPAQAAQ